MNNLIILKTIGLLPEIFLSVSIIYLLIFGSILSTYKTYPLIQNLILNLSILILIFCLILVLNDNIWIKEILLFNNTIAHDYLSHLSKICILVFSTLCLIMIHNYIKDQKINQFEYIIVILLSILGFLILCSANDFMTAYLAIELQSLSFYIMASFKKNSSFSVEAGLKYFILGSFSSAILLFGISLLYCATGSLNFEDYKDLYCNSYPNKSDNTSDLKLNFEFLIDSYFEYILLSTSLDTLNFDTYQFIDEINQRIENTTQYKQSDLICLDKGILYSGKFMEMYLNSDISNLTNSYFDYFCMSTPENIMGYELFKFISLHFITPVFYIDHDHMLKVLVGQSDATLNLVLFKEVNSILDPNYASKALLDKLLIINLELHQKFLINENLASFNHSDAFKLMLTLENMVQYEPDYFTDIFSYTNKIKSFLFYNLVEFSNLLREIYPRSLETNLSADNVLLENKIVSKTLESEIVTFKKLVELDTGLGSNTIFFIVYNTIFNNFLDFDPKILNDCLYYDILSNIISNEFVIFSLMLIFVSLMFKLALAPLHAWSPDVYEGSPTSSTLFFAVVSKLSILVLLLRIFYHSFHGLIYGWKFYIILISVLSVMVGSFTALEQKKLKSLFAYSSTSHLGYILIAFCTGTLEGIQSVIAYILIYMLSSSCIWSILILLKARGTYTKKANKDLADMSSLIKSNSILGLIFSTTLFSIAGFPPLIGFFTKFNIFLSSIESSMYLVSIISILSSIISTFYYIRIIKIICFENKLVGRLYYPLPYLGTLMVVINFMLIIFLFINPTMLFLITYKISLLYF